MDIEERDKAGTRRDDKAGSGKRDDKVGTEERDNQGVTESVVRAYLIGIQRLLRCALFLAVCSNFFLIFSFLESVIG